MKKVNIEKLFIDKASYRASDNHGNRIFLHVNYWESKFDLEIIMEKDDNIKLLRKETRKLARDLVKRKSRVNFAK